MARALIVGCGCRGRTLGRRFLREGWQARGTTRSEENAGRIAADGIEAAIADPGRVGTVLECVGDVAVVIWALGSARGDARAIEAIHGSRLERTLEHLVDTPVRGFVYEAVGTVAPEVLATGSALVTEASRRWRIPAAAVAAEREDPEAWAEAMSAAARDVLQTR